MLTSIYSADHDCHSLLVPLTTTATTLIPLLLTATLCHHHSLLTIQPLLPPLTTTNHHYHHHCPWAAHSRNPAWPRHLSFVPYLSIWHLENPEWCFGKEESVLTCFFVDSNSWISINSCAFHWHTWPSNTSALLLWQLPDLLQENSLDKEGNKRYTRLTKTENLKKSSWCLDLEN